MLFVSGHGTSWVEKNLCMHALLLTCAPKEQYEIPFIACYSDNSSKYFKPDVLSQNQVFQSVLNI
jgi:glucan phosphoethanolaminetransferase (alkaline phosphatase superfamily)